VETVSIRPIDKIIVRNKKQRVIDTDDAVLSVIDTISCYEKNLRDQVDSIGNIYTIFFHHLVIHFSGIIIQRNLENSDGTEPPFPYVSKEYALAPHLINLAPTEIENRSVTIKARIRETKFFPIALGNSIPFGYKQNCYISKILNILGEYQKPTKVFIDRLRLQLDNLSTCIEEICRRHSIPSSDVIKRNWLGYVNYHSVENVNSVCTDLLLVGNRQDLQNRKLAHNFLEQGKEVVAFTHGEIASTIFDEPMYKYAERGLCSTLVEYGKWQSQQPDINTESVILSPHRTLYRDSKVAVSMYCRSDKILSKRLDKFNVLYIPTTYVGNQIYGPFHAYSDLVYSEWHSAIAKVIPSVVFKAHPKSRGSIDLPGIRETRWLEDCIDDYDVLMLDYVSTSTALAMLTDKPVVYCDIGLRRLTKRFLESLKERCHYITIDINGDLEQQLREGITSYSVRQRCWSNLNIGEYCISGNESFRWGSLFIQTLKGNFSF